MNSFLKARIPFKSSFLMVALILTSCQSRIEVPSLSVGKTGSEARPAPQVRTTKAGTTQLSTNVVGITEDDLAAEAVISSRCVEAWRKALSGDQKGAIEQLKGLDKEYPGLSTVHFMLGQVLERAGRKKEAIKYYEDAVRKSEFDSMHLFKLAEIMRTTGDAKGSIIYYRKLLQSSPEFKQGRLGLAKALLAVDPASKEAENEIGQVLKQEPDDKEALALSAAKH